MSSPSIFQSTSHTPSSSQATSSKQAHKGKKRIAGGTGKKGKVFVEDKKDLLSLMSAITSSKETAQRDKITRAKKLAEGIQGKKGDRNEGTMRERMKKERELEAAKAKLLDKQKAKRRKKQGREVVEGTTQKRVGFA
ncbi:uncharacterized protein L203_105950 [Cryptococcus depauperatus CBS 7841]|uniref:Uncharacterized protein n=1 Tax=Cryptococcus depauperatus CBS 7841 TaxID=1295531 RepID=A0AAJ8JYC5_9TREE